MTVLHVMTGANYSVISSFINFINKNFDSKNHFFLILDRSENTPSNIKSQRNTKILETKGFSLYFNVHKYIKKNEKVIFHSLSLSIYQMIFYLCFQKYFKKMYWVAWGMDLYQWENKSPHLLLKVRNNMAYVFRKRIKYFVGIFPPDIEYYKKKFKSPTKTFYASYTTNIYNPIYKEKTFGVSLYEKNRDNQTINIQIGHSSSKILKHIEVLKQLEKFKNEKIKIFIPLSYGDREYGDRVEAIAKSMFNNKVSCIREMMSEKKYMQHLSRMDIVIFNTPRQIGLGNISPLLFMGKKIFMPKYSIMHTFYTEQSIKIQDYNDISKMDFTKFILPIENNAGRDYVLNNELNIQKKILMWNEIFNHSNKEEK